MCFGQYLVCLLRNKQKTVKSSVDEEDTFMNGLRHHNEKTIILLLDFKTYASIIQKNHLRTLSFTPAAILLSNITTNPAHFFASLVHCLLLWLVDPRYLRFTNSLD